jgi:hypothetical protein
MAAMVQIRNALMRCGLNHENSVYVMDEQGFDSTEELLMLSKESFDTMVKNAIKSAPADVSFSSASIRRLNAFKYWPEERERCDQAIRPQLFTNEVLQEYLLIMRADKIEVEAKKGQVPTKPDPLKSEKEWFRFWEKFKNYLGRIRGAAKIPLSYVVRDHDEPTAAMQAAEYSSHSKKVAALTLLSGQHFAVNNESVWEVIKTLVIDGFGGSFVKGFDRTMDGRSAIKALRRQCEGKTSIKTRRNKAYASIAGSRYKGVRKQFTFSHYVAIHQAAHNELEDCNEPMPETKKVSDFLAGISDSALDSGVTCVLSDEKYSDDFEATQQFLGTLVAKQIVHRQSKRGGDDERNASSAEISSKGGKKGNGKGKTKKKIEARFYDDEDWSKLTAEEKSQIIKLKKQRKENKNKSKGSNKRLLYNNPYQ